MSILVASFISIASIISNVQYIIFSALYNGFMLYNGCTLYSGFMLSAGCQPRYDRPINGFM